MKLFLSIITCMFVALPAAHAAGPFSIDITPGSGVSDLQVGDQLRITIGLHAEESVNAVQGTVRFDPAFFSLDAVETADSVVPLWIDLPATHGLAAVNQSGSFTFAGVIPGGITGLNGDEAFSLVVRARTPGTTALQVTDASFLKNDGAGTAEQVVVSSRQIVIHDASRVSRLVVKDDAEPPAPFDITRSKTKALFSGRWFVVFATRDAETSVDRYEIAECRSTCGSTPPDGLTWQPAESPYLLHDQSLQSTVYVRAIDQAGNAQIASLPPAPPPPARTWYVIVGLLAVGLVVALFSRYRRKQGPGRFSKNASSL